MLSAYSYVSKFVSIIEISNIMLGTVQYSGTVLLPNLAHTTKLSMLINMRPYHMPFRQQTRVAGFVFWISAPTRNLQRFSLAHRPSDLETNLITHQGTKLSSIMSYLPSMESPPSSQCCTSQHKTLIPLLDSPECIICDVSTSSFQTARHALYNNAQATAGLGERNPTIVKNCPHLQMEFNEKIEKAKDAAQMNTSGNFDDRSSDTSRGANNDVLLLVHSEITEITILTWTEVQ